MRIHPFYKTSGLLALSIAAMLALTACDDGSRGNTATRTALVDSQSLGQDVSAPPAGIVFPPDGVVSSDKNNYVVFDASGSMNACAVRTNNCQRKIDGGKQALSAVINLLPAKNVNLGLFVFNDEVKERIPLGPGNSQKFLKTIKGIEADGYTPLGKAIKAGADALIAQYKKQLGYGTYRLIVVTDGMPDSESEVRDALKFIEGSGVPIEIYTIGFGMDDPEHPLRKASVSFTAAYSSDELKKALESAVAEQSTFVPSFQGQ